MSYYLKSNLWEHKALISLTARRYQREKNQSTALGLKLRAQGWASDWLRSFVGCLLLYHRERNTYYLSINYLLIIVIIVYLFIICVLFIYPRNIA